MLWRPVLLTACVGVQPGAWLDGAAGASGRCDLVHARIRRSA